jgi:hypothetical protein
MRRHEHFTVKNDGWGGLISVRASKNAGGGAAQGN